MLHSILPRCLKQPSCTTAPWSTLGVWNVATGPCFAIAKLGTSSHIIFKGFWTFLVAFHPPKVPYVAVVHDGSLRHLGGMECCSRTLFCHSRTGHFFSYNLQRFWAFLVAFHLPKVSQVAIMHDGSLKHLREMECCNKILFYHSRLGHFFSHNLQWFLDFSWCNPMVEVASTSCWSRQLVEAPPDNGMLQ